MNSESLLFDFRGFYNVYVKRTVYEQLSIYTYWKMFLGTVTML
ncbi:hypothetical protein FHS60_001239 [Alloprevotella rava]|uniref:Uncharacterized protein n=1 Tax=Alloprevotella rava TaxID=671218 RepID=A0A7W5XY21_9BACT|nr:hypothetical protein [Alloprevotella rava]